jgi:hypothetical protein
VNARRGKMDLGKGCVHVVKLEASYSVKIVVVILNETEDVRPLTMEVTFHKVWVLEAMMQFLNVLIPILEVAWILHDDFETKS